jgi:hypothetical protein
MDTFIFYKKFTTNAPTLLTTFDQTEKCSQNLLWMPPHLCSFFNSYHHIITLADWTSAVTATLTELTLEQAHQTCSSWATCWPQMPVEKFGIQNRPSTLDTTKNWSNYTNFLAKTMKENFPPLPYISNWPYHKSLLLALVLCWEKK